MTPIPRIRAADGTLVDVAEAQRDIDYSAVLRPLTIPAGSVSGTTTISVTPIDDGVVEGDEKIRLTVPYANKQITVDAGDEDVKVTIGMVDITLNDPGEGGEPFFAAGASIADQTYTVGTAIADLVLPEAAGGDGTLTYRVSTLPAGLSFDAATRTLSGTPTEATNGAVAITYTAADDDDDAALLTFTITSAEAGAVLAFAADASIADQTYTVGTAIADLVLPRASGGAGDLRYRVLPLPAGLSFDSATRTLSGTPTQRDRLSGRSYLPGDRQQQGRRRTDLFHHGPDNGSAPGYGRWADGRAGGDPRGRSSNGDLADVYLGGPLGY